MKRIILCTDGTWDDTANNTNVYKLFNSLAITAEQIPFYDNGVGANGNPIEKLLGGAFGTGLFQKIKDGYTKIAHVYEQGDEIYLFGFSRGAYTARSIGGMITACGLPTGPFDDSLVDTAFHAYRNKSQRGALLKTLANCNMFTPEIKMIGVWDTVGSLGIPAIFGGIDLVLYGFLDTSLNPLVKNAYHALAIDERRMEFPATLWTSAPAAGQTVEQVWFCGVHSDIGGGEPVKPGDPATTLSDITLSWMMKKAQTLGVEFLPDALAKYSFPLDSKYALDVLHSSWNVIWGFPSPRTIALDASLANSVVIRCQSHGNYQPGNLKLQKGIPVSSYEVVAIVDTPPVPPLPVPNAPALAANTAAKKRAAKANSAVSA